MTGLPRRVRSAFESFVRQDGSAAVRDDDGLSEVERELQQQRALAIGAAEARDLLAHERDELARHLRQQRELASDATRARDLLVHERDELHTQLQHQLEIANQANEAHDILAHEHDELHTLLQHQLEIANQANEAHDILAHEHDELHTQLQHQLEITKRANEAHDLLSIQRTELNVRIQELLAAGQGENEAAAEVETDSPGPAARRIEAIEAIEGFLRNGLAQLPSDLVQPHGLFAAFNQSGDRPPLYWCFNGWAEAAILSRKLGPDQPLFAMRSFHRVVDGRWAKVLHTQKLARLYAEQIADTHGTGPIIIGGNCQAGEIAETIAHRVIANRLETPLLITLDHELRYAYPGHAVMLFGEESQDYNPFLTDGDHTEAWQRMHGATSWGTIPGTHGRYFLRPSLDHMVGTIQHLLDTHTRGEDLEPGPISSADDNTA